MNPRTVKPQTPLSLILGLAALAAILIGMIVLAVWVSQRQIVDARLTGVITEKRFEPAPEEQITIGRDGINALQKKGNYLLVVRVPQRDGSPKDYTVYLPLESQYNAVKVGDNFDVGPYVVRE